MAVCSSILCLSCSQGNSDACLSCVSGYFVNITTSTCQLCTGAPQCTACIPTEPGICTSCMTGFYLSQNLSCIACPSFCSSCTSANDCSEKSNVGQMVITINNTPTLAICDQGCITCSDANPGSCVVCSPGFVLIPSSPNNLAYCVPCASNCSTCTLNRTTCTSCYPGYFLNNGQCTTCSSSSCQTCDSQDVGVCTSCPANNFYSQNGTCSPVSSQSGCGQSCASCTQQINGTI